MEKFFLAIAVIALIEFILSAAWCRIYFHSGITLFSKSFSYSAKGSIRFDAEVLSRKFKRAFTPSLVFHSFNHEEIAFREKMMEFTLINYTPLMHGVIRIDPSRKIVKVNGYSNWYAFGFLVAIILFDTLYTHHSIEIFLFAFLIYGVLYLIQFYQFNKVFKELKDRYTDAL